jgi:DNA-binding NtrC family response regulator
MNTIYIVDDDQQVRESLADVLSKQGYSVRCASSPAEFIDMAVDAPPAVAVVDIFFSGSTLDGQDLLSYIAAKMPATQCIVISGESDLQKILGCLKTGAIDFIEKPVSLPRLLASVKNAASLHHYRSEAQKRCRILGGSAATSALIKRINKLAALNETVLIRGESGSGKELVAENLHLRSSRNTGPLVKVNCTALNPNLIESELFGHRAGSFTGADANRKGLFEAARGGTLFIDEIGDFPLNLQSKILRTLQEKTIMPVGAAAEVAIDVRFVFATHRDLTGMAAAGTFREDLLYRISTFTVEVPPLRERLGDIGELAPYFLRQFVLANNFTPMEFDGAALEKLKEWHYPGNIRELASIVKNAAFDCDEPVIGPEHIRFGSPASETGFWKEMDNMQIDQAEARFRYRLLERRMKRFDGNVRRTAESLGILPNNLYRLLKSHGIEYVRQENT